MKAVAGRWVKNIGMRGNMSAKLPCVSLGGSWKMISITVSVKLEQLPSSKMGE